jgi:hypothetical protein
VDDVALSMELNGFSAYRAVHKAGELNVRKNSTNDTALNVFQLLDRIVDSASLYGPGRLS